MAKDKKDIKDIRLEALESELENNTSELEQKDQRISELEETNKALRTEIVKKPVAINSKTSLEVKVEKYIYVFPYPRLNIGGKDMSIDEISKDISLLNELEKIGTIKKILK